MTYCIDTSSLIAAWQERYPIENFPAFWTKLEALIAEERLVAPIDVLHETKKRSDELSGGVPENWFQSVNPDTFPGTEPLQNVERSLTFTSSPTSRSGTAFPCADSPPMKTTS
jgi:hypothetical protein